MKKVRILYEKEVVVDVDDDFSISLRDTNESRYDEILDKAFNKAEDLISRFPDKSCMTFLDEEVL